MLQKIGEDIEGFEGFKTLDNLKNLTLIILYSKNILIDFQGETILKTISTDFLRTTTGGLWVCPWERIENFEL